MWALMLNAHLGHLWPLQGTSNSFHGKLTIERTCKRGNSLIVFLIKTLRSTCIMTHLSNNVTMKPGMTWPEVKFFILTFRGHQMHNSTRPDETRRYIIYPLELLGKVLFAKKTFGLKRHSCIWYHWVLKYFRRAVHRFFLSLSLSLSLCEVYES